MGTTAEKLYKILDSKEEIKQALIAKGINITDETTFSEYADLINEIVQGAISDADALTFIMDVADGKRKIAKAVRNKYEGTKGTASEITEYSTFDELSNKISQIPVEVPLGSAMEQNGGVLPFYDVYNETLKAMKEFAGYGFNGVCAFELDKWDYDNDHTITLSGASAYYTSDKGELITTDTDYRFKDIDQSNTNRFVVYFFDIEEGDKYQVPKSLPATSCLNLWCVKGTPLMNFNGDFTALNSINVYDGELDVIDANDFKFSSISYNQKARLPHIKNISGGSNIFYSNSALREVYLPNLTTISGGSSIFNSNSALREVSLPNLTTISGGSSIFSSNSALREVSLPNLTTISGSKTEYLLSASANQDELSLDLSALRVSSLGLVKGNVMTFSKLALNSFEEFISGGNSFISRVVIPELFLPKFHKGTNFISSSTKISTIHIGDGMRDGDVGDIKLSYENHTYLTNLTVAEGFKAKLNLTGCNGLERDVLLGIINNLADLKGTEYEDKLELILGSTLYNRLYAEDRLIATDKGWKVTG